MEKIYFRCGKPGHFKRDCPNPNREQRSYQSPNTQTQSSSRTGGMGQFYSFNHGRGQSQSGQCGGRNSFTWGSGRMPSRVYSLTQVEQSETKVI